MGTTRANKSMDDKYTRDSTTSNMGPWSNMGSWFNKYTRACTTRANKSMDYKYTRDSTTSANMVPDYQAIISSYISS